MLSVKLRINMIQPQPSRRQIENHLCKYQIPVPSSFSLSTIFAFILPHRSRHRSACRGHKWLESPDGVRTCCTLSLLSPTCCHFWFISFTLHRKFCSHFDLAHWGSDELTLFSLFRLDPTSCKQRLCWNAEGNKTYIYSFRYCFALRLLIRLDLKQQT